ncbi:MAG: site-specific DNA-methyltransferase [Syntrophothermus sp.]|uniref:site-specific DNA-methyltransferase n=1 Tax=Syntrophothermus sp. TaxID=2736299 RepID=UPI00257B399E|nr:site-specific DNA-methyltransferase [Syntrophothermus sp.]NSW82772.1 site-specific DNA-methyltransferase [Syntrophothermus sp.]
MLKPEHISRESFNLIQERCQKLKELFPEVFTEEKIDLTKLRATLGDLVDDRPERYLFTWAGKTEAIKSLQTSSWATLIPCPEESIDFEKANHIFIEGENLEVLKLLLKPYFGRVKTIYIDPPYNRGGEFIYHDDYKQPLDAYLKQTGQIDGNGNHMTSKLETNGRYHSTWLSMMYPRLFLARQLLREDGVIFISIDDNEVHNLRMLMNEVFGEENFIASIVWQKKQSPQNDATYFSDMHDYILVYARRAKTTKDDPIGWSRRLLPRTEEQNTRYSNPDNDSRGPWTSSDLSAKTYSAAYDYPITTPSGRVVYPPEGRSWSIPQETFRELVVDNRIWFGPEGNNVPRLKRFLAEVQEGVVPVTWWTRKEYGDNQEAKQELKKIMEGVETVFDTPKPVRLLKRILQLSTNPEGHDIVLDFFAGSCSIAQAVLELNLEDKGNRKFICVQIPEPTGNPSFPTIASISKERIRRVIRGYGDDPKPMEGVGFKVFKLAPSNFKQWEDYTGNNPDEYLEQLSLFQTTLVDGYRNIDVIYEVILKEGYDLNSQIEQVENVTGNTVFRITDPVRDQFFYLCLDKQIHLEALEPLSLKEDDLFICLDTALDDTTKANLALQCRLKTI